MEKTRTYVRQMHALQVVAVGRQRSHPARGIVTFSSSVRQIAGLFVNKFLANRPTGISYSSSSYSFVPTYCIHRNFFLFLPTPPSLILSHKARRTEGYLALGLKPLVDESELKPLLRA